MEKNNSKQTVNNNNLSNKKIILISKGKKKQVKISAILESLKFIDATIKNPTYLKWRLITRPSNDNACLRKISGESRCAVFL